MDVEVQWKDGVLIPRHPLKLRRSTLTIEIPDYDVDLAGQRTGASYEVSAEVRARAEALLNELAAIREQDVDGGGPMPEWTARRQERWEAFELRARRRAEERRPA